ncbi:hypothetical protein ACFZAR_07875 [Streptomyces sp. NPDC008222]|uniref:hypothetical protein n=1 Tax=Streptomyces sp. NPDC008222 TaxID=3364820 RepID=UPI0036F09C95
MRWGAAGGLGMVAVLVAVGATGCDGRSEPLVVGGHASAAPYRGPLHVPYRDTDGKDDPASLQAASGAAGLALECAGDLYSGAAGDPWGPGDGGTAPQDGSKAYFLNSSVGPAHCDWRQAHFLQLGRAASGRLYARDPKGVLPPGTLTFRYDGNATLPADARDTGYHWHDEELWTSADPSKVYVRTGGAVEAWPAVARGHDCA